MSRAAYVWRCHNRDDTVFSRGSTNTEPGAVATGSNTKVEYVVLRFYAVWSFVESMTRSLPLPVLYLSTH